jgi:lysophospholipase I
MAHSACLEELDDVEAFLRERLPAMSDEPDGKSEL